MLQPPAVGPAARESGGDRGDLGAADRQPAAMEATAERERHRFRAVPRGDEDGPFEGKHYRLGETLNSPQAIQRPRPSLLIGGSGEKKTLRLVARYADACNIYGDRDVIAHKFEVLKGHCETEGRDYGEIEKTIIWGGNPLDDVDGFLAEMEELAKLVGRRCPDAIGLGFRPELGRIGFQGWGGLG